jgi:hypothetical protein
VGRFAAFFLAAVLLVVAFPWLEQLPERVGGVTGAFGFAISPTCALPLSDGTSVEVPPDAAAALTTAAATEAEASVDAPVAPANLALTEAEGVTCRIASARGLQQQALTETGLTPRAQLVFDEVRTVFGPIPYGGFAPGGISTGHGARSAHYDGRAIDLFFRPVGDEAQRARGWEVTNWLVANAERLEIAVIIFDDRIWSARRSAQGWRPYSNPTGATDPISRHLDHIHVDVIRGS